MTATEVLRRLLDERGVEWTASDGMYVKETCWPYMGELTAAFAEYYDGTTRFACDTWCFTPTQAIAATLGSCNCSSNCTNGERTETCHMEQTGHVKVAGVDYYDDDYECSECGAEIFEGYNFCPMCGRRIEQ